MQHDGGDAAGGGEEQSGENVSLNGEEGTGEVSLNGYEKGLHEGGMQNDMINAKERLEGFDWEGLEERFGERMEECRRVEEGVKGEFEELVQVGFCVCFVWVSFGGGVFGWWFGGSGAGCDIAGRRGYCGGSGNWTNGVIGLQRMGDCWRRG